MNHVRWIAAALLAAAPVPALAEASGRAANDASVVAAVAEATRLGEVLYRYDQAAWHATDRMLEGFDEALTPQMRGYIVLPGEGDLLDAVFFGQVDGQLVEMARFAVRGSEVVSGDWYPQDGRPPLSRVALRMVAARQAVLNRARDEGLSLCANATPNTIVLPPDAQDNVVVYILTPPISNDVYPLGGHHRFEVDEVGQVTASRNFLNTCMMVSYGRDGGEGQSPVAQVVSHLLDDQPTEIHAFVSRYVPIPLMVVTVENEAIWSVENGMIRYEQQIEEPAPSPSTAL